jgi:uncharacterized delta-60 repeat protein
MHLRGTHAFAAVPVFGLLWLLLGFPASALATGGQLDTSFGGGGKVTTDFAEGEFDGAYAVAIQADGKIVAAGQAGGRFFALARYKPGGALDPSFGGDGKVTTRVGKYSGAYAVAIQADGKIVAAGYSEDRFALARYLAA